MSKDTSDYNELSEEINDCIAYLKEAVVNLDPDMIELLDQKYRCAHPQIQFAVAGERGLAGYLAGKSASAVKHNTFSDQIDMDIRESVLDVVDTVALTRSQMREIREHLLDYV